MDKSLHILFNQWNKDNLLWLINTSTCMIGKNSLWHTPILECSFSWKNDTITLTISTVVTVHSSMLYPWLACVMAILAQLRECGIVSVAVLRTVMPLFAGSDVGVACVCFRCRIRWSTWRASCGSPQRDWTSWPGRRSRWVLGFHPSALTHTQLLHAVVGLHCLLLSLLLLHHYTVGIPVVYGTFHSWNVDARGWGLAVTWTDVPTCKVNLYQSASSVSELGVALIRFWFMYSK